LQERRKEMTGTAVKEVSSFFGSFVPSGAQSVKNGSQDGFQKVWDSQSPQGGSGKAADTQAPVKKTPGDSLRARDEHMIRSSQTEPEEAGTELSEEDLEEAMAVLGTAAEELIQQIADTLGVDVAEVQSAMEELGMSSLDVLDQGKLGELFLAVSGAENSYALITNESLYGDYQDLMAQLTNVLQDASRELELDAGQLDGILEKLMALEEQPVVSPVMEEAQPDIRLEDLRNDEGKAAEDFEPQESGTQPLTQEAVSGAAKENAAENNAHEDGGAKHRSADKNGAESFSLPNPVNNQVVEGTEQTSGSASAWDVNTRDIMRQIMDYMRIQLRPETSDLEMQLHPANLGTLQIHVASKGGVVTANFITQNEMVKAALESQIIQLKENFEEQGIKVNAIEVTVEPHAFERNLDQGRGGNQEQSATKKNRTRRINLNDPVSMENMEEEDALAADMMAADGSTVNYTV